MTLPEALAKALEWCGDDLPEKLRWKAGMKCKWTRQPYFCEEHGVDFDDDGTHDIPLPSLTDELAMAMLRVLQARKVEIRLEWPSNDNVDRWEARPFPCDERFDGTEQCATNLREAIVYAVAELAVEKGK